MDVEKCSKCDILSLCDRGCLFQAFIENKTIFSPVCPLEKNSIDDILKNYASEQAND